MDILKHYLPLCWFKANPLELTRSVGFFKQNLWIYFVVEFFLQTNMTDDPFESFVEVGLETVLTLLLVFILLYLNKNLYAFMQVATAILFCSNAVAFVVLPALVWMTVTEDVLSYYVLGLLIFWDYTLLAYILRRVLAINIPACLVLALFYFAVTYYGAFALGQLI